MLIKFTVKVVERTAMARTTQLFNFDVEFLATTFRGWIPKQLVFLAACLHGKLPPLRLSVSATCDCGFYPGCVQNCLNLLLARGRKGSISSAAQKNFVLLRNDFVVYAFKRLFWWCPK